MSLTLDIITPDKKVYSSDADQVILPTESGEIGILKGHIPVVTKLVTGEIRVIKSGRKDEYLAVDIGFAKVMGDTVSVLTEAAIDVKDIDLEAVESAQARAEEALSRAKEEGIDPAQIEKFESIARFAIAQRLSKRRRR